MREPSLRTSRLFIAGGFFAAVAFGVAGFVVGRATSPRPAPPVVHAPTPRPSPAAPPVEQLRVLTRHDLVTIAGRAADAISSGHDLPANITSLVGRRFDLVIPFGCNGPAPAESGAPMRWSYDAEGQALRVHTASTTWTGAEWRVSGPPGDRYILEGFWIGRPWSSDESCPEQPVSAMAVDAQAVTLPGQTLAIAQFEREKEAKGSLLREPQTFATVQRIAPGKLDTSRGFRLRLTGRIARAPDGQPVRCIQPAGIEQRPICVIAASFSELRIETSGGTGALATWSLANTSSSR